MNRASGTTLHSRRSVLGVQGAAIDKENNKRNSKDPRFSPRPGNIS